MLTVAPILLLLLLNNAFAQSKGELEFSVGVSSTSISVSKNLVTRIRLKNVGPRAVYVYQDLDYLISTFAFTDSGKDITREFIEEAMPPPPQRNSFILLRPGQFLEKTRNDRLTDLGVHKPGKFRIEFSYNPHFGPPSQTFGYPVWSGSLKTEVPITVVE